MTRYHLYFIRRVCNNIKTNNINRFIHTQQQQQQEQQSFNCSVYFFRFARIDRCSLIRSCCFLALTIFADGVPLHHCHCSQFLLLPWMPFAFKLHGHVRASARPQESKTLRRTHYIFSLGVVFVSSSSICALCFSRHPLQHHSLYFSSRMFYLLLSFFSMPLLCKRWHARAHAHPYKSTKKAQHKT